MERHKIIEMIGSGKIPEGSGFAEIKNLSEKYPYCSTFKVLLAMGAGEKDDLELKDYINTASIYIQDRSNLYNVVVRNSLLRKIEAGDTDVEEEQLTSEEERQSESKPEATRAAEKIEVVPKVIKGAEINEDPLEEQIMAAAVMQLGELEMETDLDDQDGEEPEKLEAEEEIPSAKTAGSAFSRFLTNLDGDSFQSKPERKIIEKFISEDRKITPAKKAFFSPTQMGKMSLMEDESFVTETLAKIYERQGDYKKAARAYKNLSLKYPEKRRYFAALQKLAEEQS
jgi:hypothetical protein